MVGELIRVETDAQSVRFIVLYPNNRRDILYVSKFELLNCNMSVEQFLAANLVNPGKFAGKLSWHGVTEKVICKQKELDLEVEMCGGLLW